MYIPPKPRTTDLKSTKHPEGLPASFNSRNMRHYSRGPQNLTESYGLVPDSCQVRMRITAASENEIRWFLNANHALGERRVLHPRLAPCRECEAGKRLDRTVQANGRRKREA